MTHEFNWWVKDPEQGKCQISAAIYGSNITWRRQDGRFTSWIPHTPTDADWNRLVAEADKRVPRRLISPKQFEEIRLLRERALQ